MSDTEASTHGQMEQEKSVTQKLDTFEAIARDTALRNALIDAALDCIIMIDQQGIVIEFNPAAEIVFGYTRQEAVGTKLSDLIIPAHLRAAHQKGLSHYLTTGEHNVLNQRVEVPATNKAGDELLVELAISPVEFAEEVFFSAYLRDITEVRAAEERLRASEDRFQSLFELSPDAIVVINGEGQIIDVNSRAAELAGLPKTALLSTSALEFLPKDQIGKAIASVAKAAQGEAVQVRIEFKNASGERISTEVLGRRIDTDEGPLYHGVIRDISERIASENLLRDAKEAAESANAAKSDFLANMSHEMRTPLNGVLGSLSLVARDGLDAESASLIQSAERSAETLLTLIDDLLDLSRIEAGEVELELTTFDPQELGTIVGELFNPLADRKGLELTTHIDLPNTFIRADNGKIRQVLINLVGNALKFTQRGKVGVSIDYHGDEHSGELRFEVRDTGIGISKADQDKLFDRFKQADSSRSKSHGGAGLGLSICKELVDIMDGTMNVDSQPGEGSTFSFTIPVRAGPAEPQTTSEPSNSSGRLSGRVLIAEDSETNAMVAKTMLSRMGISHEHVIDGAAAVDAALGGNFDLVLMDVSMPVMDGLEATRILRERGYEAPIIAMTAHALKGDRDKAMDTGMTAYVTKPVRPKALSDVLKAHLPTVEDEVVPVPSGSGLDRDAINAVWDGDLHTFAQISEIFIEELDWRLPGLSDTGPEELEHHAHSLKGAASNVGAMELSRLAAELESAAASRQSHRFDPLVRTIKTEAETVREELKRDYMSGDPHG